MCKLLKMIGTAVKHSKICVLSIFLTYCLSCTIGIIMSQTGNQFALSSRDKIVGKAVAGDKASINYLKGNNFSAAMFDFKGNLLSGAIPQTILGLGIVIPYYTAFRQGWVGGIVSIDSAHESRFKSFRRTFYYFFVLLLQFIPYSLAIGAGIRCGIDLYIDNKLNGWQIWKYRIQKNRLMNVFYIYILVIPLFFIASCYEFLSAWNN